MDKIKRIELSHFNIASIIICFFFPVGGLLILMIIKFNILKNRKINFDRKNQVKKKGYNFISDIDIEKESDIIALVDSLNISDIPYRRNTVLNILKKDEDNYSSFMNLAIKNDDPETVHYVATSILNKKIELDSQIKEIVNKYDKNKEDIAIANSYLNLLTKRLKLPYLESSLKAHYTIEIIKVLTNIVNNSLSTDESYIIQLIKYLIMVRDYNSINYYCDLYSLDYPDTEDKYLTLLESYYVIGDEVNFKNTLLKLVKNNINLSKEAIDILSFWLGGRL